MIKKYQRNKFLKVLKTVGIFVLVGTVAAMGIHLIKNEDTAKVNVFQFSVGKINTTSGALIDSAQGFVTKNFLKAEGLKIEVKDDATITYTLAFYDEDKDLLSSGGIVSNQTADFAATSVPATAEYFRIMIVPNQVDGESVTCNLLNMTSYVSQLDISHHK